MRKRVLRAGGAIAALLAIVGSIEMVTASSGTRTISLYNIHTKETVTVLYKRDGKFIEAALEQINHVMRDHRKNESTRMDPDLIDLIWETHHELRSNAPVHIISGYRSRATNDLLRRTVGGQASESRHILGKAADVHFPDVPVRNIRYAAVTRERGGVGYYPTSSTPFVHLDTDRVRAWPRLPRLELALLFPSGTTKHMPADGGPLTKDDVRVAQQRHPELAQQIAELRNPAVRNPVAVAAIDGVPKLVQLPQQVARAKPVPTPADQRGLDNLFVQASLPQLVSPPTEVRRPRPAAPSLTGGPPTPAAPPVAAAPRPAQKLAAIDPVERSGQPLSDAGRFGWGPAAGWTPAPAFDEEHPEDLAYHPFPLGQFLTETLTEPLMAELRPHDVARTVELIDVEGTVAPLRLRAEPHVPAKSWGHRFTGDAVGIEKLRAAQADRPTQPAGQPAPVRTSERQ